MIAFVVCMRPKRSEGWWRDHCHVLPLCCGEPHCKVPAQVFSEFLEAAPPTTEIKFKTKFWSQMLNTQKGVSKGTQGTAV